MQFYKIALTFHKRIFIIFVNGGQLFTNDYKFAMKTDTKRSGSYANSKK